MAYGILKCDNITFDNGGSDQNVTVSGLYRATTSGVTLSGTIVAATVSGVTIIGSTTVSGATVTGTTANFTSGNFSNIISSTATMSGALIMANQQQVRFREAVGNGTNHIALQAPAIVSADQTITLPDQTGTVVTTGDNGSVTSTMILDGTILNADINASAAIAGTKISPDFGSQTIVTTGVHSAAAGSAAAPSIAFTGDLNTGIYSPGADQLAVATNGVGRLFVDASGNAGIGTGPINIAGFKRIDIGEAGVSGGLLTLRSSGGAQEANISCSAAGLAFTTNSYATPFDARASEIIFGTGSSGTERLRIDSSGNVGIGTSSPVAALHVVSASAGANSARFSDGVNSTLLIGHAATNLTYLDAFNNLGFYISGTERARIDSSGNVGIGTSAPNYQLHATTSFAVGAAGFNQQLTFGNDTIQSLLLGTGYTPLKLNPLGGNVGIGTTSPSATLELSGTGTVFKANTATTTSTAISLQLGGLVTSSNSGCFIKSHVNLSSTLNSQLSFEVNGGALEAVRIDSSGRVGIGTSAPVAKLQVATGTNDYTNAANTFGVIGPDSTGFYIGTHYEGSGAGCDLVSRGYSTTLGDFRFIALNGSYASPTERMRIDSSGNVGIGTASAGVKLEVFGASNANEIRSSDGTIIGQWYQDTNGYGVFGTVSNHPQVFRTNSAERLRIDSAGNVGIGTASPSAVLDVVSAAAGVAEFNGPANASIALNSDTVSLKLQCGGEAVFGSTTNHPTTFVTNSTERLRIDSSGNVGIGTTSPTTLLDVNADTVRVRTARTPASAAATGATGEICWDASYIYVCTATNTWKRSAISTW
jgi:hypothetical protein